MKKCKTWIRDAISRGTINFYVGQKVVVFRRKPSGYPRTLRDGTTYVVKFVGSDELILFDENNPNIQRYSSEIKVNKTYVIPLEFLRDELIDEILNYNKEEDI